VYREKVTRIAF